MTTGKRSFIIGLNPNATDYRITLPSSTVSNHLLKCTEFFLPHPQKTPTIFSDEFAADNQ